MDIFSLQDLVKQMAMEDPQIFHRVVAQSATPLNPEQRQANARMWVELGDLDYLEEWATGALLERALEVLATEGGILVDYDAGHLYGQDELESISVEEARDILSGRM
jgi:hypothetical protein